MGQRDKVIKELITETAKYADVNERWIRLANIASDGSDSSILCCLVMLCLYNTEKIILRKPCKCKTHLISRNEDIVDTIRSYDDKPACQVRLALLALKEHPSNPVILQQILTMQDNLCKETRLKLYELSGFKCHNYITCGFFEFDETSFWSDDEVKNLTNIIRETPDIMKRFEKYLPEDIQRSLEQKRNINIFEQL